MRDTEGPTFCTCSFSEFHAETMVGIPVRSSNGHPRWRLKYPLVHTLRPTMPDRHTMTWEPAPFQEAYYRKLTHTGVEALRAAAQTIRAAERAGPDVPIVLLCFERLTTAGKWCHRTLFAAWWSINTGEDVPELGGQRVPEIASDPPIPLF